MGAENKEVIINHRFSDGKIGVRHFGLTSNVCPVKEHVLLELLDL
jgi:hypothetical protein